MKASRALTPGEIILSRTMFGDAIDYARVGIVRRKWWPFQPKNIVMAPTGSIYFHPKSPLWSPDFSQEALDRQALFIHEMTHVWQAQTRGRYYLPLTRHPFCRYGYRLKDGQRFDRYGLEQQAELVRHRFLADRGVALAQVCDPGLLPFESVSI
ncbi:MAG: vgr related protein [Sphingomicrobium sp.]